MIFLSRASRGRNAISAGLALLLLFFLFLFSSCHRPGQEAAPPQAPNPYRMTHIGLCEDYPEETSTREAVARDIQFLKEMGINVLRISIGWDGVESERDQYDWKFWDDFIRIAVDENKIRLIPYIAYTPRWNSTKPEADDYWRQPPADLEEFGEFVRRVVDRYEDRIDTWEIWNEPDNKEFWTGDAGEFARLLQTGAQAVRQADPNARVVLGGIAGDLDFLRTLFEEHGAARWVEVVNLHNYFETWSNQPLEDLDDYILEAHEIVHEHGENESLWLAEIGYSTYRKGGYVSYWYRPVYEYEHTPRYQAVNLVRALTLALATEKLEVIAWYEIKDLPPHESIIGDVNNRHFGVADSRHMPKPAAKALAFLETQFSKRYRSLGQELVVVRPAGSSCEVHAFELEDGAVILVAWLKTFVPSQQLSDEEGDVQDERTETIPEIRLPFRHAAGTATRYDETGEGRPYHDYEIKDNGVVVRGLDLRGGHVCILKLSAVGLKPTAALMRPSGTRIKDFDKSQMASRFAYTSSGISGSTSFARRMSDSCQPR